MTRRRKTAGFSLAEAVVALAVFGLAGVGFLQLTTQSVSAAAHLETKLNARFVAENALAEAILRDGAIDRSSSGAAQMGDQRYAWSARSYPSDDPTLWRIDVEVRAGDGDQALSQMTAFRRAP